MLHAKDQCIQASGSWEDFCYMNLYTPMFPLGVAICDPRDFIWTNLNLLVLRVLHAKYQRIQASGSEKKIFIAFSYISLCKS